MPLPSFVQTTEALVPTTLTARCRRAGYLWCQATLTASTIDVIGITLRGVVREHLPLTAVAAASWRSHDARGALLQLTLAEGSSIELRLRGAALWKLAIDERRRMAVPASTPDPSSAGGYVHRALYHAPDFSTQLVERPLMPLFAMHGDGFSGDGFSGDGGRLTPMLS